MTVMVNMVSLACRGQAVSRAGSCRDDMSLHCTGTRIDGDAQRVTCYHCAYGRSREQIVEVAIRKMGNSQGVLIPKPILAQVGLEGTADLQVRDGVIEIRAIRRNPRDGWADDARRLAEQGGDALVWPEVANEGDDELVW